jgi:hypothetical protein
MPRHARADKQFLTMALIGYEAEKTKIDAAIKAIQGQLGHRGPGRPKATPDGAVAPARPTLSVAARKRIGAAQRKRWAALKTSQAKAPKKRKLSAAARKSIAAAQRKRWTAVRAAKKAKPVAKAAAASA